MRVDHDDCLVLDPWCTDLINKKVNSKPTQYFRLREDLQDEVINPLIDIRGDTHPALINLVLFGKASPYYHNGTMLVKDSNGEVS